MTDFTNLENLKENLGTLGKTISETAEVVTKTAEDMVEIQKIKGQIRIMERSNRRDYQHIGRIVYERYRAGKMVDEEFEDMCEAIDERRASISNYKKQVAEIKGLEMCPKCKTYFDSSAMYCAKCGMKVGQDIECKEIGEEVEVEA